MAKRIYLIGPMGCGKTYRGRWLSEQTGRPFVDTDEQIEAMHGQTVAEIFQANGEKIFRESEQKILHQTIDYQEVIVATGGGTPCFFDNLDWMKKHGTTVYLRTPPALLAQRLKQEMHLRPLLSQVDLHNLESHLDKLLQQREKFYAQATIIIEQPWPEQPGEVQEKLLRLI